MSEQQVQADVGAAIAALEHTKTADFMRYVERQLREDRGLGELSFETGWRVMIGRYAFFAAERRL